MTVTVFLASMCAVAIAAIVIFVLTSGRDIERGNRRAVRLQSDHHRDRHR